MEPLQVAASHLDAGRIDAAEQVLKALLQANRTNPWVLGMLGCAANKRGNHRHALSFLDDALKVGDNIPQIHFEKARAHASLGASADALQAIRRAIVLAPNTPGAYEFLSRLLYPGEYYYDVLRRLQEHLRPRSYLEIGVESGASLALCSGQTIAVGIDPAPLRLMAPKVVTKIFPMTSDAYFECRSPTVDAECETIDLTFIDGLHTFEQTLRDFVHVERYTGPRSVVIFHDVLPIDALTAGREQKTVFWTGDIWKIPLCLTEMRPDLEICVIPAPPSGLCLVRRLDSSSKVLADSFGSAVDAYISMDLDTVQLRRQKIPEIANDWDRIREYLDASTG